MRIFQHATFDYWRVPMAKQNCCWMLQVKVGSMSRNQITQYRYSSSVVKLDNKQSASIRNVIINGSKTMMPKWYSCLWHFVNPPCTEKRSGAYANFESGSGKTINHVYKCSNPKKDGRVIYDYGWGLTFLCSCFCWFHCRLLYLSM